MMHFDASVAWSCLAMNVGFGIENLRSSWIWRNKAFTSLVSGPRTCLVRTDLCMWGTTWQKGICIMTEANLGFYERRFQGCKRGL